jgi:hypothetical protein
MKSIGFADTKDQRHKRAVSLAHKNLCGVSRALYLRAVGSDSLKGRMSTLEKLPNGRLRCPLTQGKAGKK